MITKTLDITNRLGLHARAAGALVKLASSFACEITVEKDGTCVNSKSIMGLLMLAASQGTSLRFTAEGADEKAAMEAIEDLLRRRFNEQ